MRKQILINKCNKKIERIYNLIQLYLKYNGVYPDLPHVVLFDGLTKKDNIFYIDYMTIDDQQNLVTISDNIDSRIIISTVHRIYHFDNIDNHCSKFNLMVGKIDHIDYLNIMMENLRI